MALIKCSECRRDVSDRAYKCPNCGNPLSMRSSTPRNNYINAQNGQSDNLFENPDVLFERRIDEYIENGYVVHERKGETVKLFRDKKTAGWIALITILIITFIAVITLNAVFFPWESSIFYGIAFSIPSYSIVIARKRYGMVTISLTRTGNIEEIGNVLKN